MKTPKSARTTGNAGLANETRPGLGTRSIDQETGETLRRMKKPAAGKQSAADGPLTPDQHRPEPAEQNSASLEQEEERSTGVSGHSGGT
jgi:hypothetical protein